MVKYSLFLLVLLLVKLPMTAQEGTEIYLFDLVQNDSVFALSNPVNISKNKGYDNQPSFLNDGSGILFSSTRNNQTDIVLYNLENHTSAWLTDTPGNEYSPIQTPNKRYFSAIYLEEDGTQLLWKYPFSRSTPTILLENLKVGYHVWLNKRVIVSFVLNEPPTLEVSNLKFKIKYPIDHNIGRSILKIPNTEKISYMNYEHGDPEIYAIDPYTSEKEYIADALQDSQDLSWTPDGTMIMGSGDTLYKLKPGKDKEWIQVASLKEYELSGITRLCVSPLGNKIAIVVTE